MEKRLLLMGIIVMSLVMLFIGNVGKSFPSPNLKKEVSRSLSYCVAAPGLPLNRSSDEDAPHFRANPSFHSQPPSYFFRIHHPTFCSFKSLFNTQNIEKYRLAVPSTFLSFFITLFRVIISPNAP